MTPKLGDLLLEVFELANTGDDVGREGAGPVHGSLRQMLLLCTAV
jgi:hypothetical protein